MAAILFGPQNPQHWHTTPPIDEDVPQKLIHIELQMNPLIIPTYEDINIETSKTLFEVAMGLKHVEFT